MHAETFASLVEDTSLALIEDIPGYDVREVNTLELRIAAAEADVDYL